MGWSKVSTKNGFLSLLDKVRNCCSFMEISRWLAFQVFVFFEMSSALQLNYIGPERGLFYLFTPPDRVSATTKSMQEIILFDTGRGPENEYFTPLM